jgi:hypothetical protein
MIAVEKLIPYINNARVHDDDQVTQIASSIKEFGWGSPILTDGSNGIIAGHGRLMAAKKLGMTEVPCIEMGHLSEIQRKALILSDNRIALSSTWDEELLKLSLRELNSENFDLNLTGFNADELATFVFDDGEDEKEEKPKEINYAIQYNLVFDSEMQQESWFNFIKNLKTMYPEEETLGGRLRAFIQERSLGEA